MSTFVCEKQFTLQVAAIRPPTNYWKLTTANAGLTLPSVGAINLNVGNNWQVLGPGKISGTALSSLAYSNGQPDTSGWIFSNPNDIRLVNLPSGFTMRFWTRCDDLDQTFGGILNVFFTEMFGAGVQEIWYIGFDFNTVQNWGAHFFDAVNSSDQFCDDFVPLDQTYHRAVFRYDPVAKKLYWKFDNNPTVTLFDANGFYTGSGPPNRFSLTCTGNVGNRGNIFLSELGIWQNILLTEAELLVDWNNGSGLSFP